MASFKITTLLSPFFDRKGLFILFGELFSQSTLLKEPLFLMSVTFRSVQLKKFWLLGNFENISGFLFCFLYFLVGLFLLCFAPAWPLLSSAWLLIQVLWQCMLHA